MHEHEFQQKTRELIDSLKNICAHYGLGNDGNEFKIITQSFLYKFLNDKFAYEAKKIDPRVAQAEKWEDALAQMSEDELEMLQLQLGADTARLKPSHFIGYLFSQQNAPDFAKLFDDTLRDIAISNNEIFAVKTEGGAKVVLFDRLSDRTPIFRAHGVLPGTTAFFLRVRPATQWLSEFRFPMAGQSSSFDGSCR
jgi:type I restriction enzyme M protein